LKNQLDVVKTGAIISQAQDDQAFFDRICPKQTLGKIASIEAQME